MAAATIPEPGTDLGPCPTTRSRGLTLSCGHVDCAASRATAAAPCGLCGARIGYDRRYYQDQEHGLVHASCLETHLEQARRCPRCGNDPRYTPPDHPCDHGTTKEHRQ